MKEPKDYLEQFNDTLKKAQAERALKQRNEPSKLSVTVSVKDTEEFKLLLDYTRILIDILEKYPLAIEERRQVDAIFNNMSKKFYEFKRKVES